MRGLVSILNDDGFSINNRETTLHIAEYLRLTGIEGILDEAKTFMRDASITRGDSFVHENGFTKIALYKNPLTGFALRLHLWPEGVMDATIHNHRWSFLSFVAMGNIECKNYSLCDENSEDSEKASLYKLRDADALLRKESEYLGEAIFKCTEEYSVFANGHHLLDSDTLHHVSAKKAAISIMISGAPTRSYSTVIKRIDAFAPRKAISAQDCINAIDAFQILYCAL